MLRHSLASALILLTSAFCVEAQEHSQISASHPLPQIQPFVLDPPSLIPWVQDVDLTLWRPDVIRRQHLQEQDYEEVAKELDVDAAAIHAVIDIEAGPKHQGFWTEGEPVVYFSLSQFRKFAAQDGINIDKFKRTHPKVFTTYSGKNNTQANMQQRVNQAMDIDSVAAIKACFWGMFQIGGFNWKLTGAESPQDFYNKMKDSERSQVELFVHFLQNTGLDEPLHNHDWKTFARGYNGPTYLQRGYHTRLARAYRKYAKK